VTSISGVVLTVYEFIMFYTFELTYFSVHLLFLLKYRLVVVR
jgi:hypothetical protein